eukprot:GHVN01104103.1.p1 GENE.GHVN01104103.1~~GHVN01104103.1.p1  ORF type:complete len:209 (+),score=6.31 GHVN01104103.1:262-888(+)
MKCLAQFWRHGFTTFNDLAVAAVLAINEGRASRVLVVDADVHQGDGTVALLRSRQDCAVINFYCDDNFPFPKEGVEPSDGLNIGFPRGTGDHEYITKFELTINQAFEKFLPDLVIYDAGVDTHQDDILGRLNMTDSGIERRDEIMLAECVRRQIPVCCVIGGGYDENRKRLVERHSIIHQVAARLWQSGGAETYCHKRKANVHKGVCT